MKIIEPEAMEIIPPKRVRRQRKRLRGERLSPLEIGRLVKAAKGWPAGKRESVGGNLYVQAPGSWSYRNGTAWVGFGSVQMVPFKDAADRADRWNALRAKGQNPVAVEEEERQARALEEAKRVTFKAYAEAWVADHEVGWKNAKHRQQWKNTLSTYVYPVIGGIAIADVDTQLVLQVLRPFWNQKPETGSRVRQRIEMLLDAAKAEGVRSSSDNPARWRGHLDKLLTAKTKLRPEAHHAALPYDETPAFMQELRGRKGVAARALELVILCASRSGEVRGAMAGEFDLANKVWTIAAPRMKGGKEHRVPLSDRAVEIVKAQLGDNPAPDKLVFPGLAGKPLSDMSLEAVLRRMKRAAATVHGFRSTFHDWASERTNFPNIVVEMALAHAINNRVEAAYRRGDLFMKRAKLMAAWGTYCTTPPRSVSDTPALNNVTALRRA